MARRILREVAAAMGMEENTAGRRIGRALEPGASRGMLVFAPRPVAAVDFFKERLKPLRIEASEVRGLIEKLRSEDEKPTRVAKEELKRLRR